MSEKQTIQEEFASELFHIDHQLNAGPLELAALQGEDQGHTS